MYQLKKSGGSPSLTPRLNNQKDFGSDLDPPSAQTGNMSTYTRKGIRTDEITADSSHGGLS